MNHNIQFHDKNLWSKYDKNNFIAQKTEFLKKVIPPDVKSVIDIGCGNGLITRELKNIFPVVVGCDISAEALSFIEGETICSSCDSIPVSDQSFDLVFSSEMIEHLDDTVLKGAISEMSRISRKYILITVPNSEVMAGAEVKCNICGCVFHQSGHLQRFTEKRLNALFSNDFSILMSQPFGAHVSRRFGSLIKLRQRLFGQYDAAGEFSVCPSCGNRNFKWPVSNIGSKVINFINTYFTGRKNYWYLLLLERKRN